MILPQLPNILEINTAVYLHRMSKHYGRPVTLANVPDTEWDKIAAFGFDAVWFMGVWERSPTARDMGYNNPSYSVFLEDLQPEDVIGSAYSIARYEVSAAMGGREELAIVRTKLAERGMGLLLDFVPNHVGFDHHWIHEHPEYFIQGSEQDLTEQPDGFYKTKSSIVAKGKDPNFGPWPDVAQLNAYAPELRQAAIDTLRDIGTQCDGVRCDMAMLQINDIFGSTWGDRVGQAPEHDFWPLVIQGVRAEHPDLCFIAEVYWEREAQLLEQGFSYCYDKKLYDLLMTKQPARAREHIAGIAPLQDKLLRFIANHDEGAPAGILSREAEQAAAVILATLPSARLYFDSQLTGYPEHIPVELRRGPVRTVDPAYEVFYEELLRFSHDHGPIDVDTWQQVYTQNDNDQHIVACSWKRGSVRYQTFINYSADPHDIPYEKTEGTRLDVVLSSSMEPEQSVHALHLLPWQYLVFRGVARRNGS